MMWFFWDDRCLFYSLGREKEFALCITKSHSYVVRHSFMFRQKNAMSTLPPVYRIKFIWLTLVLY
jgi:hypothetical protein